MNVRDLLEDLLHRSKCSKEHIQRKLAQYDMYLPVVWTNKNGRSFMFWYGYGITEMKEKKLTQDIINDILEEENET